MYYYQNSRVGKLFSRPPANIVLWLLASYTVLLAATFLVF